MITMGFEPMRDFNITTELKPDALDHSATQSVVKSYIDVFQ